VLVLAALLLLGEQLVFLRDSGSGPSTAGTIARGKQPHTTLQRIGVLVSDALGPSDRGVRRYRIISIKPDPRNRGRSLVHIEWAINGDLSLGSVSAWSQVEVYLMLRALYTAKMPLSYIQLTGTFGDRGPNGAHREVRVLDLGLDARTASLMDWATLDAVTVWPLLHHTYSRSGFECQCQE
jgi:hypothetical protein